MFKVNTAFSGISVNDLAKAKDFYTSSLDLKINNEEMGLNLALPGGGSLFIYEKPNHSPASFTVLNFVVGSIDEAVDYLASKGIDFERYDEEDLKTDDKGIARGLSMNRGPDIAWFKDPAGNILSVLQLT